MIKYRFNYFIYFIGMLILFNIHTFLIYTFNIKVKYDYNLII